MRQNTSNAVIGPELGAGARTKGILAKRERLGSVALAALVVLSASAASAQDAGASSDEAPAVLAMREAGQVINVLEGHSKLLQAAGPLGTILLGDDNLAAATIGAGNSVVLTGLAAGSTNLIVLSEEDEMLMSSEVVVVPVAGRLRSTVTVVKGALTRERYECRGNNCEWVSTDAGTTEVPLVLAAPGEVIETSAPAD